MYLLLLVSTNLLACDVCNMYMSINPNDYKNTISLVHRYRQAGGTITGFSNSGNPFIKHDLTNIPVDTDVREVFKSYELWGRFFLGKKWQLNASVSFADNYYYQNNEINQNVAGVGDMILLANYQVLSTISSTDSIKFRNRLLIGGGVKLPTGAFNKTYVDGYETKIAEGRGATFIQVPNVILDPHIQPGTGSTDLLLNAEYMMRLKNSGVSFINTYRISTTNKNSFRYANRYNAMANIFHIFKLKKLAVMPHIGAYGEMADNDRDNGEIYLSSGGKSFFTTYGLDMYFEKISVSFMYQLPFNEELYGNQVPSQKRLLLSLNYLIN